MQELEVVPQITPAPAAAAEVKAPKLSAHDTEMKDNLTQVLTENAAAFSNAISVPDYLERIKAASSRGELDSILAEINRRAGPTVGVIEF